MIYELRTYEVAEDRMGELVERFSEHTIRLFKKHGIRPVLFLGKNESNPHIFSYVVSFDDNTSQTASWDSFIKDSERITIWDDSNKNGKLVINIESTNFDAIEFKQFSEI